MKKMKQKNIPTYNVILWDINHDQIEYYDIMLYLVGSWKDEKKYQNGHVSFRAQRNERQMK